MSRMGIGYGIKRFYQTNLANGEFAKHKGGYLAAAVLGYIVLHAACGCVPSERGLTDEQLAARVAGVARPATIESLSLDARVERAYADGRK